VAEKLLFDHTVESLLRTLERPIPPAQIAGLDALGLDLSKPLLPAYTLDTYVALIDFISQQRWPNQQIEVELVSTHGDGVTFHVSWQP
jgi:hypothetical protein